MLLEFLSLTSLRCDDQSATSFRVIRSILRSNICENNGNDQMECHHKVWYHLVGSIDDRREYICRAKEGFYYLTMSNNHEVLKCIF